MGEEKKWGEGRKEKREGKLGQKEDENEQEGEREEM